MALVGCGFCGFWHYSVHKTRVSLGGRFTMSYKYTFTMNLPINCKLDIGLGSQKVFSKFKGPSSGYIGKNQIKDSF